MQTTTVNSCCAVSTSLLFIQASEYPQRPREAGVGITPIIQMSTEAVRLHVAPPLRPHLSSTSLWGSQVSLLQLYKDRQGGSSLGIKNTFLPFSIPPISSPFQFSFT